MLGFYSVLLVAPRDVPRIKVLIKEDFDYGGFFDLRLILMRRVRPFQQKRIHLRTLESETPAKYLHGAATVADPEGLSGHGPHPFWQ